MKRLARFLILLAVVFGFWWLIRNEGLPSPVSQLMPVADKIVEDVKQAANNVAAPPPLRATGQQPSATTLTRAGVLQWTNYWRQQNGAASLALNDALNKAAQKKLADMFAKQYFEHVSPDGVGPGELATSVGYAYVEVGENLALGDFGSDKALVQAWMDSPGHRANILHAGYTQIGIAVGKGTYEGRVTWIAVQEFGRPASACPAIDASLKAKIDADRAELDRLKEQAQQLMAEIEASPKPRTREERDAYNAKVDQYNALVNRINPLITQLQGEITVYNGEVQAYNACAGG